MTGTHWQSGGEEDEARRHDREAALRMLSEGCPNDIPDEGEPIMAEPNSRPIEVSDVRGRYPSSRRALRPENIDVMVLETSPGILVVRLDDRTADDFWLQLTVELRGTT